MVKIQHMTLPKVLDRGPQFVAEFMKVLGDRLCWVYDLPVHLYGELSIFGLYLFYTV